MKYIIKSYLSLFVISFLLIFPSFLLAGSTVVPHDKAYYKYKDTKNNIEIIYTKDNINFAKHTASIETSLNDDYKNLFNWELDETLYVGLISSNNQIANGFSTQYPNNRQINYVGGALNVDYFSSTSWLDTLLYHETAHNYQLNVKGSIVSRVLHSIFSNAYLIVPLPIIMPNSAENSFMLEGNAVLNESWHGNGGRLYSGRFRAETILQAKASKIKAGDVYNSKIAFPYGNIHYIQGGFYNLYMAEKYGLKAINSYFLNYSYRWYWSFLTNKSMYDSVGVNFEDSLDEFASSYAKLGDDFVLASGDIIAYSQFFYSLGSDKNEIFFITNESGDRTPELIVLDKKTQNITKDRDSWIGGKVIKIDGEYLTQGSNHTSVFKIDQGLFDKDAFIKQGSASKVIQGYLSDGRDIYFDVASSYSQPQLYVAKEFYAQVNSSVIIDAHDNLYYFKQDAKTRTLYKNKTPLFSYEGFYGMVGDVDSDGAIYFVANSELGSTLYLYKDGYVSRASRADNIVEARLIDDETVLLACVSDKDYYYTKDSIDIFKSKPFETKLFFEDKEYYAKDRSVWEMKDVDLSKPYYSVFDMHYSSTDVAIVTTGSAVSTHVSMNLGDPLSQNNANIYLLKDELNVTIAGVSYTNTQYLLRYQLNVYGTVDNYDRDDVREYGFIASAELPFLRSGYYYGAFSLSYYQDYYALQREPLSLKFELLRGETYGVSMYKNYFNSLEIYGAKDRDDSIYGASYLFKHELGNRFYFGVGAKYSKTNTKIEEELANTSTRGVKVSSVLYQLDNDHTAIHMPSVSDASYFKSAGYADISLAKVFNYSYYFFTFPFSLQRESLYAKYRYYELQRFNEDLAKINISEISVGTTISLVLLNTTPIPLSLEYIYNNDSSKMIESRHNFSFNLDISFGG